MKKVIITICMFASITFAQPDTLWNKLYQMEGNSGGWAVIQTMDGGYALTGNLGNEPFLMKTDANGDSTWFKVFHNDYSRRGLTITETIAGDYLVTASIDYAPEWGWGFWYENQIIYRVNANGELIWTISISQDASTSINSEAHLPVICSSDGGYLIGYTGDLNSAPIRVPGLMKLDSAGLIIWTETYFSDVGILSLDNTIAIDEDVLLLTGRLNNSLAFVLKVNFEGDSLWSRIMPYHIDIIEPTTDGGFIIRDNLWEMGSDSLRKTDSFFNPLWVLPAANFWGNKEVHQSPDNGFVLTGWPGILKLDSLGEPIWTIEREFFNAADDFVINSSCYSENGTLIMTGGASGGLWLGKLAAESTPVSVGPDDIYQPTDYRLFQNFPNPFNPTTTISYEIPEQTVVKITVFDIRGQEITKLQDATKSPGNYELQWNGVDQSGNQVSTGVYFCRLRAGTFSQTIKMVYLR